MIRKRIKKKEGINSAICQYGGLTRFQVNYISRRCATARRNPITLPSGFNLVMACFKWLTSGTLPLRVIWNLTCRATAIFSAKKNVRRCLIRNSITGSSCSVVITSTECIPLNSYLVVSLPGTDFEPITRDWIVVWLSNHSVWFISLFYRGHNLLALLFLWVHLVPI